MHNTRLIPYLIDDWLSLANQYGAAHGTPQRPFILMKQDGRSIATYLITESSKSNKESVYRNFYHYLLLLN